jgi:cohesin loading factor subunit SCC2
MLFDQANVPFRYLTPESPEPEPKSGCKGAPPPEPTHRDPHVNGFMAMSSSQQRKVQAVVVQSGLTPAQRAQYQYVPESEMSTGGQDMSSRGISVSQRQKGDQAVQNLQDLLLAIFEAEASLEPDGSGVLSARSAAYFTVREGEGESAAVLQPQAQSRLELFVHKASSCGRLGDIEVEDLLRVQRLCEPQVTALESLSLQIGEDWSTEDVEEWLFRVRAAESGLAAARTLTWIMTGVAQNKELQSEDHLRIILEGLRHVVEGCLIPIVQEPALQRERIRGEKEAPPANPKFVVASNQRKEILTLLYAATKCLRSLGDLLVKNNLDESEVSSVEYLCKTLIFAENASTDKDSAIGVQNFEALRRCGMDVLAKIFTKYTEQRQYIFDEILISLEKLPATKQSARQYRLAGAKPIQLVSALLMRLVQTSATRSSEALRLRTRTQDDEYDEDDADASVEDSDDDEEESDEDEIKVSPSKGTGNNNSLSSLVKPLNDAAQANASYIIHVLIQRALSTTKSSEEPYRKLLDIFTEDFISCLGTSDWPAAELLLRALTLRMIGIIEKESSSVPSRTFALELLGNMGSGILELQMTARRAAEAVDPSDQLARPLRDMVRQLDGGNLDGRDILAFDGPYRKIIEYLNARNTNDDAQLTTARGYYLMQWAHSTFSRREGSTDSDGNDTPRSFKDLQAKLKQMLLDPHWFDEHGGLDNPTAAVGNLAAMVVALNSPFCKAFNKIFGILLSSMTSESSTPTVKSRSLKSVTTILDTDKSLLERNANLLNHIVRCMSDNSPSVRDSALGLIGHCVAQQPALSSTTYKQIILRTNDGAVGVRKRAMKMLKDIYLQNNSNAIRSAIANAIIARIEDTEESVIEIARTTMEEIWFQPLYPLKLDGEKAIEAKLAYTSHAALFIETVERRDDVLKVLEALLKRLLAKSKATELNARVCKTLIAVLFDGVIDNNEIPGAPEQDGILRSLTIFARACPRLFTSTQLERLEPYTKNLDKSDNLDVYRSVVSILRYVLPHQPVVNQTFLATLGGTLMKASVKLPKAEVSETVPCLWTVSGMIQDTQRVSNFVRSMLVQVGGARSQQLVEGDQLTRRIAALIMLVGEFGNACDFSPFLESWQKAFPSYKGKSVADLIVETVTPFTSPTRPLAVREAALDAVCSVAQASPKCFLRKDVENAFVTVFQSHVPSLEVVMLRGLEAFFIAQETPEEGEDDSAHDSAVESGTDRLSKTYVASDTDGASIAMAQRFISDIIRIAVSSYDEPAFAGARLVVSINKQGMVHPKDSVPALVALETCPNKAIAAAAFKEHKSQHSKHESLYDKEYMRAVQRTFEYQQRVIGDAAGYLGSPPTAKMQLTWEVLKIAKATVRKKFLSNIALKMDFDPSNMQARGVESSQHLLFVRFCVENVAFLEYDKVDDLMQLLATMEKVFAGTGSVVAQAIESEVLKLQVDGLMAPGGMPNGTVEGMQQMPPPPPPPVITDVDPVRLQRLAISSQILTLIWETRSFLVRLWNMQKHMHKSKQQKDKDTNRAPNRSSNAPSLTEAYLKRVGEVCGPLDTEETCRVVCSAFAELISVDTEVKVGSEEDADDTEVINGYDTPSEGSKKSPSLPPSGTGRGRKRKLSNADATPRKRGRPSLGGKRKSAGSAKFADDDDDEGGWD